MIRALKVKTMVPSSCTIFVVEFLGEKKYKKKVVLWWGHRITQMVKFQIYFEPLLKSEHKTFLWLIFSF